MSTTDETSSWTIVGIDCASQDAHIGLARGTLSSAGLMLSQVQLGKTRERSVAQVVADPRIQKVERETVEWGRKPGSVPGVVAFAGWRPFI